MKRIFLVEDDQEIARNLIRLLSREGFAVTHAANQKETSVVLDEQRLGGHFFGRWQWLCCLYSN